MALSQLQTTNNAMADNEKAHVPFQESHTVKCTKPDCEMLFASAKNMKRHKRYDPEHFYCRRCDVDCEDWEALTRHKIDAMAPWLERRNGPDDGDTPKHIVCEFCGQDFQSFGGRKAHRKMEHPADQELKCPGHQHPEANQECRAAIFTRAANLVEHIEDGRCKIIGPIVLRTAMFSKYINKKILEGVKEEQEQKKAAIEYHPDFESTEGRELEGSIEGKEFPEPNEAEELAEEFEGQELAEGFEGQELEGGGVSILDEKPEESEAFIAGYLPLTPAPVTPRPRAAVPNCDSKTAQNTLESSMGGLSMSGKATQTTPLYPYSDSVANIDIDESATSQPNAWQTSKNTSKKLFPTAKPTPGDWKAIEAYQEQGALQISPGNLLNTQWWNMFSEDYRPDQLFDPVLRAWKCPFPECPCLVPILTEREVLEHMVLYHFPHHYTCPTCLKRFEKAWHLVAHAETTQKCNVRASSAFKSLIDEITGGLLEAKSKSVPKLFRPETAVVKHGEQPTYGIMDTKFKAKKPDFW